MNESKNMNDYFTRFFEITNQMKTCGEFILGHQIMHKILINLKKRNTLAR